jgi:tetratricopeptide (TPR) repeat protein
MAIDEKEKARIAASDARDMIPLEVAPLAMGYIYEAQGETKRAGESYEKAVKARSDNPLAIRVLADFYFRNRNLQRASPLIDRLLSGELQSSESDLVSARRMKAAILASQGYSKLKEATALIDRNLASSLAQPQDKRLKVRLLLADPRRIRGPEVRELAESLVMTGGAEPDPEDRFQLARLDLARGDWGRCREQMGKLVNGSQCNPTYLMAYVRMLLDQDQLSDAEQWLDRLERVSNPGETVALRAELLYRKNEWGKVADFLDAYVRQENAEPKDPSDRLLLAARLLESLGARSKASKTREVAKLYFEKACQQYESYVRKRPTAQMLLAGYHARNGKVEEALQGIERYGEKSGPWDVFEVVSEVVSRPETSPAQLKKLESEPLLVALAETQSALDRPQDSEKIYREILRKDPHDNMACNNLSMILALQKVKLDEAYELIDKTIERTGPQGSFLDTRAVALIARGEPQRALEDLEIALTEKVTPLRLFHKAWACHELAMDDKAKEMLQSAKNGGLELSMLTAPEREIYRQIIAKGK